MVLGDGNPSVGSRSKAPEESMGQSPTGAEAQILTLMVTMPDSLMAKF